MKSKLTQGRYRAPKRSACGLCKPQQRGRYFFFPVVHCWPLNAICLVAVTIILISGQRNNSHFAFRNPQFSPDRRNNEDVVWKKIR